MKKSVKSINPCQSVIQTSYDIVKAHRGELKVDSKEAQPDDPIGRGEGTKFIVKLPID